MNYLKRELAPLIDTAWSELEEAATNVLKANLSARRVVDVDGPKGFDFSAVNLGRLDPADGLSEEGVRYGIRSVLPLTELRVPFKVDTWELDDLARGASDVGTEAVIDAALRLARFEERALYNGFAAGQVKGLTQVCEHPLIPLGSDYPDAVAHAMLTLADAGVAGPYALVLGSEPYRRLAADVSTYPPRQRIAKMIEGPILRSSALEGGLLLSLRGGDYSLTLGEDIAIGYQSHDNQQVSLYLTESFTFRVLSPEAIVHFSA